MTVWRRWASSSWTAAWAASRAGACWCSALRIARMSKSSPSRPREIRHAPSRLSPHQQDEIEQPAQETYAVAEVVGGEGHRKNRQEVPSITRRGRDGGDEEHHQIARDGQDQQVAHHDVSSKAR